MNLFEFNFTERLSNDTITTGVFETRAHSLAEAWQFFLWNRPLGNMIEISVDETVWPIADDRENDEVGGGNENVDS